MTRLIRSEALKVTSIRAPWVLTAAVAVLAAVGSGLLLLIDNPMGTEVLTGLDAQRALFTVASTNVFALILGVLVATGDHRHGTATPTYVITPDRLRPFLARTVVTVTAVLAMTAAVAAALSAVAIPVILTQGELMMGIGDFAAMWGRDALLLVGWGLLGLGVGEIVRSQVGAIVGSLVFLFVAGPLVSGLLPDIGRFLPSGLENIVLNSPADAPFGAPIAGLLFAAYAAVALAAGSGVLTRRDIA